MRGPGPGPGRRCARAAAGSPDYRPVGGTTWQVLPPGFRTHDLALPLGHGADVFTRAAAALTSWEMHADAGVDVRAPRDGIQVGDTVLLRVRWLPVTAPCRIVAVADDARCAGFVYGTLPGHPERGEELFAVDHDPDDEVWFRIRAFSRPAHRMPRPARVVVDRVQDLILGRYLEAMARRGTGGGAP